MGGLHLELPLFEDKRILESQVLLHARGLISWELIYDDGAHIQSHLVAEQQLDEWVSRQQPLVQSYIRAYKERFKSKSFRYGGVVKEHPLIVGIINATPDSFSDGGDFLSTDEAIRKGLSLMGEGADIIDIGGESTRPGAKEVTIDEELKRVIPVVEGLTAAGAVVSVDTRHSIVMEAAIAAGAKIINDVSALEDDEKSIEIIKKYPEVSVILMHKQGQPANMQQNFHYNNVVMDVFHYLLKRIHICEEQGIARHRIAVDPGIGFGKSVQHNLSLMGRLSLFRGYGCPVMIGASRKSFIAAVSRNVPPKERTYGSIAAALWSVRQGVSLLRVHDVRETKQALDIWQSIQHVGY